MEEKKLTGEKAFGVITKDLLEDKLDSIVRKMTSAMNGYFTKAGHDEMLDIINEITEVKGLVKKLKG